MAGSSTQSECNMQSLTEHTANTTRWKIGDHVIFASQFQPKRCIACNTTRYRPVRFPNYKCLHARRQHAHARRGRAKRSPEAPLLARHVQQRSRYQAAARVPMLCMHAMQQDGSQDVQPPQPNANFQQRLHATTT